MYVNRNTMQGNLISYGGDVPLKMNLTSAQIRELFPDVFSTQAPKQSRISG